MFCAPGLVFGVTEGVVSCFHVLRSLTRFWRYRGVASHFLILLARTRFQRYRARRVMFSCFARLDSFSAIPRASGPVLLFCALKLIFGCNEGVGSRYHIFALPDSFSAVPRASAPVIMFCTPGLIFGGTESVPSRFYVVRSRTCFRRYRGRRVPFHVLRSRTHFRWYRGRWVPFSCFMLPESFSAVPGALGPIFLFCALGLVFGGSEGVGSRFRVLCFVRPDSFSVVPRVPDPLFMFCATGLFFDGTEGVGSRFNVLRVQTHFRRYRGRPIPFSCFPVPDMFSAVSRASGPISRFTFPD
jgi:hypothetical protein